MTGDPPRKVYLVHPPGAKRVTPGIRLRVELAQRVGNDKVLRAHFVGRCEVRDGGELALTITEASEAGRQAAAMLDDDIVDVLLWGTGPTAGSDEDLRVRRIMAHPECGAAPSSRR